jgi:VWFA-related protein
MCKRFVLVLAVATLGLACGAQSAPSRPTTASSSPALHASPRSTVLGVAVQDQDGHPVRGLTTQNFRVTEGGVPQTIARMEEHSSEDSPRTAPLFPALAPDTFTNYTPIARGETLNILVIDALNTPSKDAGFLRSQLRQYVRQAKPNTRIAVFGLANRLILLQGFTSDPSVLRDVVERKLIARVPAGSGQPGAESRLGLDPSIASSSVASATAQGGPSAATVAANLRAFEEQLGNLETGFRVQYTLDAFNTLAHYLGAFPGRKNLIWFSGSFPFNLIPDPSLPHPFQVADADADELRETAALLSSAQVAVYPVDARSLIAASAPSDHARPLSIDHSKVNQSQAAERSMMEAIATSTGGRAFYNPESLADAVSSAVAAGSNYYTLTYTQANPENDSSYRPLRVDPIGVDAAQHVQLSYRRGDFSGDATSYLANGSNGLSVDQAAQDRAAAYGHAAMKRGAPTPEDLVFRVRVVPASTTSETALPPDDGLVDLWPSKGPYRRYDLDFLALSGDLTFSEQPDGRRVAKAEFFAYAFDAEGRLLANSGRELTLEPRTNDEAKMTHTLIRFHLEVSVPERVESFLRIGMRDVATNKFGVIEIPTSAVTVLPGATDTPAPPPVSKPAPSPAVPAPAAPAGRATPPQV